MEEINSPFIGINIDTVPLDMTHTSLKAYFKEFKSKINHFHFCDRNDNAGWIPCGDGHMPIPELLRIIDDNEYSGSIGLEICGNTYYKEPDVALTRALKYLRACMEE